MLAAKEEIAGRTVSKGHFSLSARVGAQMVRQIEFGDFSDNLEVFVTALYGMKNGFVKEGLQIIRDLRQRIVDTGEAKSSEWLLPKLDSYLKHGTQAGLGERPSKLPRE